jgi:hypothetical protein
MYRNFNQCLHVDHRQKRIIYFLKQTLTLFRDYGNWSVSGHLKYPGIILTPKTQIKAIFYRTPNYNLSYLVLT